MNLKIISLNASSNVRGLPISTANPSKVAFGGGWENFLPKSLGGQRTDSENLITKWSDKRNTTGTAKYITTKKELLELDVKRTDYVLGKLLFHVYEFEVDRA